MLNFYVKHCMIVEKVHETLSLNLSKWLKKYLTFNTRRRKTAKTDFEKDFFKLLVNSALGKLLENIRNRLDLELIRKDDIKNFIKRQTKLTFNGIHKPYENYDKYTLKKRRSSYG